MFYDHHFIGMHWIWWIIITIIAVLIFFDLIPFKKKNEDQEDPINILKKRFARGEIEKEEFDERKRIIKETKIT